MRQLAGCVGIRALARKKSRYDEQEITRCIMGDSDV
jgi:hypothetical protein